METRIQTKSEEKLNALTHAAGVYFFVRSRVNNFHAIWHCFVLGGTIAHYVCVYKSI